MGMLSKVLFLDDRGDRIHAAIRQYSPDQGYELRIVTTAKECIKELSNGGPWNLVSLDHDLGFQEMQSSFSPESGMAVVTWICENQEFLRKTGYRDVLPFFRIHTTNQAAGYEMAETLNARISPDCAKHIPWKYNGWRRGALAGAFDVIHPGYIRLFKDAKKACQHLTILLHDKPGCVLSMEERTEILLSIRQVDDVIPYGTEEELTKILVRMNKEGDFVRVNGSDHKGKSSRDELGIPTYYHERNHDWSATKLKKMYGESVK